MSDDPFRDRPNDPAPKWDERPSPDNGDSERDWTSAPPPPTPETDIDGGRDQAPHGGWYDGPPDGGYEPTAGWGSDPLAAGERPASVGKRAGAFIIDSVGLFVVQIIVGVFVGIGAAVSGIGDGAGWLPGLLLGVVGPIAYFALMEANAGQTVGKMALGIKAVSEDGGPLTLQQGVIRRLPFYALNIVPLIGWLATLALGIAIIVTAAQDEPAHQGLHDKWAKTRVIEA